MCVCVCRWVYGVCVLVWVYGVMYTGVLGIFYSMCVSMVMCLHGWVDVWVCMCVQICLCVCWEREVEFVFYLCFILFFERGLSLKLELADLN